MEIDMERKLFKNHLIVAALLSCFITSFCSAQAVTDSALISQFERSYYVMITYPSKLSDMCIPVMCLLRLEVGKQSKIDTMIISDSADSLYREDYKERKEMVDLKPIEEYCARHSIVNKTLIIPLYYTYRKSYCPSPVLDYKKLAKYYQFNGKDLEGNVIILKPIILEMMMHY